MKAGLTIILLLFCCNGIFAQIQHSPELDAKLAGKTKFQDIKATVINHYSEKLQGLSQTDSVVRKKIMRQLKMWNRQFWISENYVNAKGEMESPSKVVMEALEKRKKEEPLPNSPQAQSESWVNEGPISTSFDLLQGEGVGRIDRITFHPTDVTIMFAGSPHGGLFKTTDGGANWFPISAYVASLGVSGIVVNPVNPDIIYVLSGDGNSSDGSFVEAYKYRSASNGVYKTTNGGATWFKLPDFPGVDSNTIYQGRQLVLDPANPNVLMAATSMGLFRTSDAGNTWTASTENVNVWDVKFKPGNSSVVYCVGNNFFRRSANNGLSFPEQNVTDFSFATRISMAVTPANSEKVAVFAGNSNNNSCVGVFISTNGGTTFTKYASSANGQFNLFHNYVGDDVTLNQCDYNNTIVINPADENLMFIGGLCVWVTHDGGANWEQSSKYWASTISSVDYIHPDQHMLAYNPLGTLFCVNDGGVYRSTNTGSDWDFIETGLSTTQFYHFEVENDDGNTWGGAQDNGILERINGGEFSVYHGGDGYDVMTDHPWRAADGESNNIYYTVNQDIRGDATDISVPGNTDYFGNLAMDADFKDQIYVGYQTSIYRSVDAGENWFTLDSIPGNWSIAAGTSHQLKVYSSGTNAKFPGGICRWGGSWDTTMTAHLVAVGYKRDLKITDIEVNKSDDDSLFISVAGTDSIAKVFSSSDQGTTWHNLTFNLPNVPAFSIKQDETGGVYVGTSIGVYYKRNGIDYWEPFYNGLPPVPVTQIELYANNNRVQISTFGRGLWSTAKYGGCTDTLNLSGQAVGRNYWEVSDHITSNQKILNQPGTNIIYSAGNKITFKPGTHIEMTAKFKGIIQPCGGRVIF
jgi:photosystem II stability/assembly factor-like uncharacterized protein